MNKEEFDNRRKQRFVDRNQESIDEIHRLIEADELRFIVTTHELIEQLKLVGNLEENWDLELHKYNGVRIIFESHLPSGSMYGIKKDADIKFKVPCMCGIYDDEPHDKKLR